MMSRMVARYPMSGLPAMAGMYAEIAPANARTAASNRSRPRWVRAIYSRRPCAIASVGDTFMASRAGENADATETPTPINKADATDMGVNAMDPGRLLT